MTLSFSCACRPFVYLPHRSVSRILCPVRAQLVTFFIVELQYFFIHSECKIFLFQPAAVFSGSCYCHWCTNFNVYKVQFITLLFDDLGFVLIASCILRLIQWLGDTADHCQLLVSHNVCHMLPYHFPRELHCSHLHGSWTVLRAPWEAAWGFLGVELLVQQVQVLSWFICSAHQIVLYITVPILHLPASAFTSQPHLPLQLW
jgi:hypothetical protein